jgi:ankyrin repeat protein
VDRAGRTPLHYAAADGNLAEVRRLLAEGASPGAADDDGRTPLHFAAQGWHVELARTIANYDVAQHFKNLP